MIFVLWCCNQLTWVYVHVQKILADTQPLHCWHSNKQLYMYHKLYNTNFKRTDMLKHTVIYRYAHTHATKILYFSSTACDTVTLQHLTLPSRWQQIL